MDNRSLAGGQPKKKTMGNQKNQTGCPKGRSVRELVLNTVDWDIFSIFEIYFIGMGQNCMVG